MQMTTENYLMVNKTNNVCENIVIWDGNTETWTPPSEYLMLQASETWADIWVLNADKTEYQIASEKGAARIGFVWDGVKLKTNEPKPTVTPDRT